MSLIPANLQPVLEASLRTLKQIDEKILITETEEFILYIERGTASFRVSVAHKETECGRVLRSAALTDGEAVVFHPIDARFSLAGVEQGAIR